MATYQVTHRTEYRYESNVSSSYGEMHLLPRDLPTQTCQSSSVLIDPPPHDLRQRTDFFGNRSAFFAVLTGHTTLAVKASSTVEVRPRPGAVPLSGNEGWEEVRDRATTTGFAFDVGQFALDSPLIVASTDLEALARPSFAAGRPVVEAVGDLSNRIHNEFAYEPGATTVTTPIDEVLARRAGVCQDFAHVLIGCLRSLGLAARYVSGYLETDPPPGRPRLQGADVSHAWVSFWTGDGGWVDVDPTNAKFVGDRHITTGWGRDYSDVPPLKGVIYTKGAKHELDVTVDVVRQDGPTGAAVPPHQAG